MKFKQSAIANVMTASVACAFSAAGTLAHAQDAGRVERLEQQIKALGEELKQVKDAQAADRKETVVKGDADGSVRVPGSDTSIRVYGFIEATGWKDFKAGPNGDFSSAVAYQPLAGSTAAQRTGSTEITARTSRFGIEASRPTAWGLATGKIELDFARTEDLDVGPQLYTNSYRPRLRHAYVSVGPVLFGQTWSTFMDVDTLPETLDFNGPPASPFVRQPMLRYSYATERAGKFTLAIENSASSVNFNSADNFDTQPDLIGRWDFGGDWGSVNLRGLYTKYRLKNASTDVDKDGYGIGVGAFFKSVGDDWAVVQATAGKGLGRYMVSLQNNAVYDAGNNKILLENAWGVVAGYQRKWSGTLRSNISGAYQRTKKDEYVTFLGDAGTNKTVYQGFVNTIWTALPNTEFGLEYIYGQRLTFAQEHGTFSRLMASAKFIF